MKKSFFGGLKLCAIIFCILVLSTISPTELFAAGSAQTNNAIATKPVYVPDMSRVMQPLTAFAWDATMKMTNVPADSPSAHLDFNFTNVGPDMVGIVDAQPSCSCTSAQTPPLPWLIAPGTNGVIGVTVNLAGRFGTVIKDVHVRTDHGSRDIIVQINILPPVMSQLTDAERMRQMAIAKVDRQAVFKNDCATCHMKRGEFKYGKELYDADCGICHEAEHRASMVPDLHNLKVSTNPEFWRTWIAHGKPGTFMPAFSEGDGGPLNDMQISSLAAYLSAAIPSKVPSLQ
jgi:mono/diheme cytochrome c family protein